MAVWPKYRNKYPVTDVNFQGRKSRGTGGRVSRIWSGDANGNCHPKFSKNTARNSQKTPFSADFFSGQGPSPLPLSLLVDPTPRPDQAFWIRLSVPREFQPGYACVNFLLCTANHHELMRLVCPRIRAVPYLHPPPSSQRCYYFALQSSCLYVGCLSARTSQKSHVQTSHEIFCTRCPWPWLGPPPTTLQYVTYFRFCGRRQDYA